MPIELADRTRGLRTPDRAPASVENPTSVVFTRRRRARVAEPETTSPLLAPPPRAARIQEHPGEGVKVGRSALVLGWFFASERELELVRRLYKRNGFDDVVVEASHVATMSKPRGWYRQMRRNVRAQQQGGASHALARHFDVIHVLSGGYLHLYTLVGSGVGLSYDKLLLDSTPILPDPVSVTRFTRSWLHEAGHALPLRLVSQGAHLGFVRARWGAGLRYVRLRERLSRAVGREKPELGHFRALLGLASSGDFARVAALCTDRIVGAASEKASFVFLYNPDDPYISAADVEIVASMARGAGFEAEMVTVGYEHVRTLFKKPKVVFDLLGPATDAGVGVSGPTPT